MSKDKLGLCPYPNETCEPSCRQCIERAKPTACVWSLWDNGKGWHTTCFFGPTKQDHPVAHSLYTHCPFCGGTITEVKS